MVDGSRRDVVVWGVDLKTGRMPRVSPISGQPAETARKYRFRTAPTWSWLLIVGGILLGVGWIPGAIIRNLISAKAAGPIFLTPAEKRSIRVKQSIAWGLLMATIGLMVLTFALAGDSNAPTGLIFLAALITLIGWVVTVLLVLPRIRPKAVVRQIQSGVTAVEFKQVHPAFAAAVQQLYQPVAVTSQAIG
jgi:Na+-transporting methylmalonyl-CoA/oxaloacetate decarboxylase gamma subunit